jgi:hypothetical protein
VLERRKGRELRTFGCPMLLLWVLPTGRAGLNAEHPAAFMAVHAIAKVIGVHSAIRKPQTQDDDQEWVNLAIGTQNASGDRKTSVFVCSCVVPFASDSPLVQNARSATPVVILMPSGG